MAVSCGPSKACASPYEIRGDDRPCSRQGTGSLDRHLYFTVTRAEPGALSQLLQPPWPPCNPAHLVSIHPTLPSQLQFSYFLVRASELSLGPPVSPRTEGQRAKKPPTSPLEDTPSSLPTESSSYKNTHPRGFPVPPPRSLRGEVSRNLLGVHTEI